MSAPDVIDVEPVEHGALVPFVARPEMTPAEVRATVEWQAELLRAVLEEDVDYGVIRGTPKPSLWKPGAEKLLKAFGFGHYMEPLGGIIERDEHGRRLGVTYRCVVTKPMGDRDFIVATCEGYCGYDDRSRRSNDPWNTIVKMAQKRALVGACLPATGTSGLLTQDMEDYQGDDDEHDRASAPPPRQPTSGGMPVCANCGGSLAGGAKVKLDGGRRIHADGCPKSTERKEAPTDQREEDGARDRSGAEDHRANGGAGAPPAAITAPQRARIMATLGGLDRDERLARLSTIVGRTLGSTNELTKDEAGAAIDAIERGE